MGYRNRTSLRAAKRVPVSILLVGCGLLLGGCSFETPDVGRLADDAAKDIRREGSELLSGEDTAADGASRTVTVERVIDGDTIEVSPPAAGRSEDVRLLYVDTPESAIPGEEPQPYGEAAAQFATERLEGKRIRLGYDTEKTDPYGRALATVTLPGEDRTFNETLVARGYAQVAIFEPNDSLAGTLYDLQSQARQEERGIWSLPVSERCELADRGNKIGEGSAECGGG